ncbi:MAG: hypothetical protein WCW56_01510 [Candidatus Paceibacterota bacterium]|jgi:hypothetical protein
MKEDIEKIIYYGTLAPSGDNSQPWRFKVKNNSILLYSFPERDTSVYNSNNASINTAHGAVIENIVIASKNLGYGATVLLFPNGNDNELTARVDLTKDENIKNEEDISFETIEKRCTNRKPYFKKEIPEKIKTSLMDCISKVGYGRLILEEDNETIKKLSKPLSYNEKLALETKEIHNFLFHHLTWTEEEQKQKRIGMGMKTLELKFPKTLVFKLLRFWPIMNFFNKTIHASDLVAKDNEKIFNHSAMIGTIIIPSDQPVDIVNTGRVMQRVWLTAAQNGLSTQLLTGIGFFHFKLRKNDSQPFNEKQITLIEKSYNDIADILKIDKNKEYFLISFRLGYDGEPAEHCYRLPPQIDWL